MNRRGFLLGMLAAGAAPAILPSGVLMPIRALWIPRAMKIGDVFTIEGEPGLLTITQIVQDTLRLAHENGLFVASLNRGYELLHVGDTLRIRIPEQYKAR